MSLLSGACHFYEQNGLTRVHRFKQMSSMLNMASRYAQLIKKKQIREIIDFGDLPVFKTATTYPCIISISNKNLDSDMFATYITSLDFPNLEQYIIKNQSRINQKDLDDSGWTLSNDFENEILKKTKQNSVALKEYTHGNIFWE